MTRGQHIRLLCKEHGIRRTVQRGRGRARVKERWIQHPPLRDEMAYFVALHEIGHMVVSLLARDPKPEMLPEWEVVWPVFVPQLEYVQQQNLLSVFYLCSMTQVC